MCGRCLRDGGAHRKRWPVLRLDPICHQRFHDSSSADLDRPMGTSKAAPDRMHIHDDLDVLQRRYHGNVWQTCTKGRSQWYSARKLADIWCAFESCHCLYLPLRGFLCTFNVGPSCGIVPPDTDIVQGSRLVDLPPRALPSTGSRQGRGTLHLCQLVSHLPTAVLSLQFD